jgi:hypothetical protein
VAGRVVRADDAHRALEERRLEELEAALELATARYRAAEEMLVDNMPEDWLVRATGHHTFESLWATDSDFVESMRLEARALLEGGA